MYNNETIDDQNIATFSVGIIPLLQDFYNILFIYNLLIKMDVLYMSYVQ